MTSNTNLFCFLFASLFVVTVFAGCDAEKTVDQGVIAEPEVVAKVDEPAKPKSSEDSEDVEKQPTSGIADDEKATKSDPVKEMPKRDDPVEDQIVESQTSADGFEVVVGEGGALNFKAPGSWKKAKPRSSFVEYEITVPKSEGEADDAADGRLTMMGAMGSVDANIKRWYGQYTQPDGSDTADNSTVTDSKVAGCDVKLVDIKGTLMDRPGGPMAGGAVVERENYRMLASIIQAGEHGQYFVKLYGPAKTIADNEAAFKAFVESLTIDDAKKGL